MDFEIEDQDEEYPEISREEIDQAQQSYPLRADLMNLANEVLSEAKEKRMWKPREPQEHEMGWQAVLHDGNVDTAVGLWSCWLGDKIYLGYPKELDIADELIMELLGVELATPVPQVSATAVNDSNYAGECKDPDKSLETNKAGQVIAYRSDGPRTWAKFFGPKEAKGGRVWIDKSNRDSQGCPMPVILNNRHIVEIYFGHDNSKGISTFPFTCYNKYSPDSPTTEQEAIQKYRNKFIRLLAEIATLDCNPTHLTIDYGFVMVPEQLEREEYEVNWLKGKPGTREGWGKELVVGRKPGETIMLKSANSMVPWSNIRDIELPAGMNAEYLCDKVQRSLTF